MSTNHARDAEYEVEMAFAADGRILAMRAVIRADIGAYVRTAALVPSEFGAALLPGPYRVPHYACDLWSVVTNKTPVGTLRSPGRPGVQLRARAAHGHGGVTSGTRSRRDPSTQPDPPRRDALRLRHQVVRGHHSVRLRGLSRALRRAAHAGSTTVASAPSRRRSTPAMGFGGGLASPSTWRRPDSVPSRPRMYRHGPTDASRSTPAPPRWDRDWRRSWLRSWPRRSGSRPTASMCGTPIRSAVESGVGTYGSRATVTAGNAASMAATKLIGEARTRAAEVWHVPETDVSYARRNAARRAAASQPG